MNRVLVVFSDGLLSELDSARGLVSRSAWIRQAVEDKLMKEAVAPLVPDETYSICGCGHPEALHRKGGRFAPCQVALCECEQFSTLMSFAEPKPKADREKSVKGSPAATGQRQVKERVANSTTPAENPSLPARCNRGACTGTIKPNGRCIRCNQEPLKESK